MANPPIKSPITPQYGWDPRLGKTGRYVDLRTGKIVPRTDIAAAMERRLAGTQKAINTISRQFAQGNMSLAEWQTAMKTELKLLHTTAGALAKGGWGQMSQSDYGAIGAQTKEQYKYLQRFAQEIESGKQKLLGLDGKPSKQFLRRADMYGQAARGTNSQMERREANRGGATEERRVRHSKDSCEDCVRYESMGWQKLGTFPPPGVGSRCRTNCRCHLEYR